MMGKHFPRSFFYLTLLVTLVSCVKEQPPVEDSFNISGIYLPSTCIYAPQGGAVTLEVKGGHGPELTDKVVLADGQEWVLAVSEVGERAFSFLLDEAIASGTYTLSVRRADRTKRVGELHLIVTPNTPVEPGDACTVYGLVSCSGKGLPGVVVSDGVEVTTTDESGVYRLASAKKHGYVFMSVPAGYKPVSDGILPLIHRQLAEEPDVQERVDFNLLAAETQDRFSVLMLGDIHLANRTNDRIQFQDFVKDINAFSQTFSGPVYGLTLGDMTWDLFWETNNYGYREYLADAKAIRGLTIYQTIGNHDHSMYEFGDFNSVAEYKRLVAPTYYSFNIGKVHFVVLDDVECINDEPTKDANGRPCYVRAYDENLVQEQFDWLEKDLATVPSNTPLVVSMHIPLYTADASGYRWSKSGDAAKTAVERANAQRLEEILSHYPQVHLYTGHTHTVYNADKTASKHIFEHNSGAVCGTWWWSGYETPGVHIGPDGSPGGYALLNVDGDNFSWAYKATGSELSYQFRTYDRNNIVITADKYVPSGNADHKKKLDPGFWSKENTSNEVYINVWNYDPSWKVEVTEGGNPLAVEAVFGYDPLHLIAYTAKRLNKNAEVTDFVTRTTHHLFKVTAGAPDSTLEIKVTDRFGNVYTETMTRPKAFDIDTYIK